MPAQPAKDELTIGPASSSERAAAFRLAFPHLSNDEVREKHRRAEEMIATGELNADGVRLAKDSIGLAGAMLAAPVPGAAAVVWPPFARVSHHYPERVQYALCADAVNWLRSLGVRLAQALVPPEESRFAAPLLRHGFVRVTRLLYLRHFLDLSFDQIAAAERFSYRTYDETGETAFLDILTRSYEGTLDCPEINNVRVPAEVLAGHRAAGPFDPGRWWLAHQELDPLGMVLATMPEPDAWDIAYLGVVPEARRRGVGNELVRKLLFEAKAAGMMSVTLAVDERNLPARALYKAAGFESFDERDVYLATWTTPFG